MTFKKQVYKGVSWQTEETADDTGCEAAAKPPKVPCGVLRWQVWCQGAPTQRRGLRRNARPEGSCLKGLVWRAFHLLFWTFSGHCHSGCSGVSVLEGFFSNYSVNDFTHCFSLLFLETVGSCTHSTLLAWQKSEVLLLGQWKRESLNGRNRCHSQRRRIKLIDLWRNQCWIQRYFSTPEKLEARFLPSGKKELEGPSRGPLASPRRKDWLLASKFSSQSPPHTVT